MHGRGETIRAGSRGGRDQFEWDDVKVDKHRENYLAHSLLAPVGRWQKGKDLTWYTKDSKVKKKTDSQDRLKNEIAAIKRAEEEAMAAALGLKPASSKPQQTLSKQEIAEVCRRRSTEEAAGEEAGEVIKGVGYQSRRAQMMYSGSKTTTTKDGATVFEHDPSLSKDDNRLTLVSTPKQLPVTSAAPPGASPEGEREHHGGAAVPTPAAPLVRSEKRKDKRKSHKKDKKKKRKKERRRHDSDSDSDQNSEWVERPTSKTQHCQRGDKPGKRKRQNNAPSSTDSDSPADRQRVEKHREPLSRHYDKKRRLDSDRMHKRRRHDTYDSD